MNVESHQVPSDRTVGNQRLDHLTKKVAYSLLRSYTSKMIIPSHNCEKVVWLSKNLATRNSEHPDFQKAMHLVDTIIERGWA
jgi:hypothetical protein